VGDERAPKCVKGNCTNCQKSVEDSPYRVEEKTLFLKRGKKKPPRKKCPPGCGGKPCCWKDKDGEADPKGEKV